MRSPKLAVTWPSTGQRLGAELARYQSAVVALRVIPKLMPTRGVASKRGSAERAQLVQRGSDVGVVNLLLRCRNQRRLRFQP